MAVRDLKRRLLAGAASAACLLTAAPAFAAAPQASDVVPSESGAAPAVTSQDAPAAEPDGAAPGKAMADIVITAQRTPAKVARQAQKEAPNLINVQTYQEIQKLPDISTAEAVRRIPGLSLETDEGEGRYVNIRGFDADLNSTTFGGLRLPPTNNASPFGGYRAVALDSIPIGLVGAITVTKSNVPSMDAEALGGTIEITPKTVPAGAPFFAQGNIGSGFEPLRGTGILDDQLTAGGHYGPFSLLVTGTYNEDSRGIDDVEPAYFNDSAHPYQAISNIQQRDYELNRKRHAYGATLRYDPDPDDGWYVRAFDAGYVESYKRPFLNLSPDGNTNVPGNGQLGDTLNGPSAIQFALRDENERSADRIVTAGGRNVFDGNILDYDVGYTLGTYHKPFDYNSTFTYTPAAPNGQVSYGLTGAGHTPAYTIAGAGYLDPANYQLSNFANSTADNSDREYSAAANLEHATQWTGADQESIKFGASARIRRKQTTAQPYSYNNLDALPLSDASSGGAETYYNGQYQNPPDIVPGYLQSKYGPGQIAASDVTSAQQQFLDARENVFGEYVQYQAFYGPFSFLAGVRLEQTADKAHAFEAGVDQDGNPFAFPVTASNRYNNVFPSIQFRYEIEPTLIARVAYSTTIARPGFNQANAALSVDLGSGIVARGNPNLQPATADGFDISLEKYLENAGIFSIGFFDKEISNYIVSDVLNNQSLPNNGLFPGNPSNLRIVTYTNAASSYARGIELNWDQHFKTLPGFLSGFGASANYTFVDSSFQIRPGERSSLPSTSQNTANAAIFYEKYGLSLRLAAYYVSADLFAIGSDKSSDVFNADRTFLDFGGSYAFTENLSVYFNAKNLLDTPHTFYQGSSKRPIQREFYNQTALAGLRFDF